MLSENIQLKHIHNYIYIIQYIDNGNLYKYNKESLIC